MSRAAGELRPASRVAPAETADEPRSASRAPAAVEEPWPAAQAAAAADPRAASGGAAEHARQAIPQIAGEAGEAPLALDPDAERTLLEELGARIAAARQVEATAEVKPAEVEPIAALPPSEYPTQDEVR